jgi:hypothetical protein
MTDHAPGPWRVTSTHENARAVVGPTPVADAYRVIALPKNSNDGHWEANARLIAAAPDLLAACKAALEGQSIPPFEKYEMIRAAIAKATGGVND